MNTIVQGKPKLPGFINLLLVIVLGISLAKLMWLVLTPEKQLNTQVENSSDILATKKEKVNYGKLIANQHLFGEVKKKKAVIETKKPPTVEEKVVTPTRLNLKLHGIVAYTSKKGFALISSDNGPQKSYGPGETIQEGVTIGEIYPDKVVLDNHGQAEELLLPKDQIISKTRSKRPRSSSSRVKLPGESIRSNSSFASNGNKPNLTKFRKEMLSNPSSLMQVASPSPAIVDGRFIGFRVQPGSKRKFFMELGFKPNDIITEVNGIILDEASKGAMVLGELRQAADVSVTVMRGDQEIFIQHSF